MKFILIAFVLMISIDTEANETLSLSHADLVQQVTLVNKLQNHVLMSYSTPQDVANLFSAYTDDFIYEHKVYGGVYTREHLLSNTLKYQKKGKYQYTKPRYKLLNTMVGLNAIAVTRLQDDGAIHLSVFEFKGNKVSRIIEYWK